MKRIVLLSILKMSMASHDSEDIQSLVENFQLGSDTDIFNESQSTVTASNLDSNALQAQHNIKIS